MFKDKGVLLPLQEKALRLLGQMPEIEHFYLTDVYFLLKEHPLSHLMDLAAQKDSGFDPYWFAVALQRARAFPDEPERWPVKMLVPFDPRNLKQTFQHLALEILRTITGGKSHA